MRSFIIEGRAWGRVSPHFRREECGVKIPEGGVGGRVGGIGGGGGEGSCQ